MWKKIVAIALVFLILDFIFLGFVFRDMWRNQVISIQKEEPVFRLNGVALLVYIIMISASYIFVVKNHTEPLEAAKYGALLGLAMYGVFDGTNYVLFKNYTLKTVIIDTLYGMFVTSLACYLGSHIN